MDPNEWICFRSKSSDFLSLIPFLFFLLSSSFAFFFFFFSPMKEIKISNKSSSNIIDTQITFGSEEKENKRRRREREGEKQKIVTLILEMGKSPPDSFSLLLFSLLNFSLSSSLFLSFFLSLLPSFYFFKRKKHHNNQFSLPPVI